MNDTNPLATTALEERIAERLDSGISHDLVVSDRRGGIVFENAGQVMEFAKMMAISNIGIRKHLRGNVGACLAVAVQAIEWRMSIYAVANKSYSVNDQLCYESQLIQAVILQRAPIKGRFKVQYSGQGDARICKVWANLRGSDEIVEYESPLFGKIQPKNSPLWKTDPDQQQFYYSGRALCRRHFPDVLLGVYDRDEIEERDPEDARDITPSRSLSDKLDALANGGEPVVTEDQKKRSAAEDASQEEQARTDSIAKEKKTRKASAPKADEAAGTDAGNKAGASQAPQPTDSGAPAPNTETAAAASPPAAKSATVVSTPPDTTAAAPKGLTPALKTGLRRFHEDAMGAMGLKKLQAAFDYFIGANELQSADAAYVAAETVLAAHKRRIAGEGSPSEADTAFQKAIAS